MNRLHTAVNNNSKNNQNGARATYTLSDARLI